MVLADWDDVLKSITIGRREWDRKSKSFVVRQCNPTPVPLESLNAIEQRIGFKLPQSYRDFCCVFGGGELSSTYHILIPDASIDACDIEEQNTLFHEGREYDEYSPNPVQYQRAFFFARDILRGIYFWDPQDITDRTQNEYGIYVVFRDWDTKRLADTFREFIIDLCLGDRHQELFDDTPERFYQPYSNVT